MRTASTVGTLAVRLGIATGWLQVACISTTLRHLSAAKVRQRALPFAAMRGARSSRGRRRIRKRDLPRSPSLPSVQWPLTEFDDAEGLLRPRPPRTREPLPRFVVLCFFPEVLRAWEAEGRLTLIGSFSDEVGRARIYLHGRAEAPVAVFHPGMGGPLASHCLENVRAAGVERVVAVGGAGSLIPDFLVNTCSS